MKVILSRKGFDSANGGIPSAVLPNGNVVSFPIPSDDEMSFSDMKCGNVRYDELLKALLPARDCDYCHVDPNLDCSRWNKAQKKGKPSFGQIDRCRSIRGSRSSKSVIVN